MAGDMGKNRGCSLNSSRSKNEVFANFFAANSGYLRNNCADLK
jgi:hypothetical protein